VRVTAPIFNATSDYRIKDNVISLADCSFMIDPLRPVSYHNKITNQQDIGLIAHELQDHFPFLVTGEKDGETNQSVNYNGLIGLLIHEIQQLKQKTIPELKQTITTLENHTTILDASVNALVAKNNMLESSMNELTARIASLNP
jgi:hypothetical protein